MSDYVRLLEACIQDARNDQRAESVLRSIIENVAAEIPVPALAELGAVVLRLHKQEMRRLIECN